MATPIQRRFSVTTLIRDKIAGIQNLSTPALVVTTPLAGGVRYLTVDEFDWDVVFPNSATLEYKWLQTMYGQELVPRNAMVIHWDKAGAVETVEDALNDAITLGAAWYFTCYEGVDDLPATITEQTDISNWVESHEKRKQCILMTQDVNAHNLGASTDIGAIQRAATINRTSVIFHPASVQLVSSVRNTSEERPDAAILGRLSATPEGLSQWSYNGLSFVTDSGLSAQQQMDLKTKGYNFIETFENTVFTHMYNGTTITDREIRIQWGADWHDVNVESAIATFAFEYDLMAFDIETFTSIEGILREWKKRALGRRIIVDTKLRPAKINLPDPDTLSAAVRASGIANFSNVYDYGLNTAITDWILTGNWRITI
jgi:hypothetical protein